MVEEQSFKPGEVVPESGIYQVMHYQHRLYHEATLVRGSLFPQCLQCEDRVRFRLVMTAAHIDADRDFRKRGGKAKATHATK